jgi:hypothetical protein
MENAIKDAIKDAIKNIEKSRNSKTSNEEFIGGNFVGITLENGEYWALSVSTLRGLNGYGSLKEISFELVA